MRGWRRGCRSRVRLDRKHLHCHTDQLPATCTLNAVRFTSILGGLEGYWRHRHRTALLLARAGIRRVAVGRRSSFEREGRSRLERRCIEVDNLADRSLDVVVGSLVAVMNSRTARRLEIGRSVDRVVDKLGHRGRERSSLAGIDCMGLT